MEKYFVIIAVLLVGAQSYPTDLPRCKAGDTACLKTVITQTLGIVKDGRQDINLPSIDPLRINKLDIVQGDSSPIAITLNFRDQDLIGLSGAEVTKVVGFGEDPRTSKYELEGYIRKLTLAGKYKINGKVLVLPIQGKGRSNLTLENVNIQIKFQPKVLEKNGKTYIQTDKFKLTFDTTRLRLQLDNLFNGDRLLGDNMNRFLNENWEDILRELKPAILDAFAQIFSSVVNSVFSRVSYDEIFEK